MSDDKTPSNPKDTAASNTGKKGSGKFKKGKSGNPAGRPKGSRNKTTLMAQALIDGQAEKIIQKVIDLGLQKDFWPALKASLDRIIPPAKSTPLAFEMPPLDTLDDLPNGNREVMDAFCRGDISADDMRVMNELLDGTRRTLEAVDLTERVEVLENTVEKIK